MRINVHRFIVDSALQRYATPDVIINIMTAVQYNFRTRANQNSIPVDFFRWNYYLLFNGNNRSPRHTAQQSGIVRSLKMQRFASLIVVHFLLHDNRQSDEN